MKSANSRSGANKIKKQEIKEEEEDDDDGKAIATEIATENSKIF